MSEGVSAGRGIVTEEDKSNISFYMEPSLSQKSNDPVAPSGPKRAVLTVKDKRDVCDYKEQNPTLSQKSIAQHFSLLWGKTISRRCVGDILSEKEKWLIDGCASRTIKKPLRARHEMLEDALADWITELNNSHITVTDQVIRDQAKVFGTQMAINDFVYSNGWLQRFKQRRGLSQCRRLPGETIEAHRARLEGIKIGQTITPMASADLVNTDDSDASFLDDMSAEMVEVTWDAPMSDGENENNVNDTSSDSQSLLPLPSKEAQLCVNQIRTFLEKNSNGKDIMKYVTSLNNALKEMNSKMELKNPVNKFPGTEKLVHLDLKGAPPKVTFYHQLFPLLKSLGATGVLIEYEDMFPYFGKLAPVPLPNAYKPEEIDEILQLAIVNNLTVIPLIQTIGHMEFVLKHKEFMYLREVPRYPNNLCPCNEDSGSLVLEMVSQIVSLHPDITWLHLGADEVWHLGICEVCKTKLKETNAPKEILFLFYIKTLAERIKNIFPHLSLIIWDDMLRNMESSFITNSGIADLVEIMVWHYVDEFNLKDELWEKYCNIFNHVWIASAFKGATDIAQMIPPIQYHINNHLSWLRTVSNPLFEKVKLQGIALTGWQRYDHFTVLCELFPVALPSLAVCLQTIADGCFSSETLQKSCQALGFSGPIPLDNAPTAATLPDMPSFPGASIYMGICGLAINLTEYHTLLQHQCYKGAFTEYLLKHFKTNPLHIDQFLLKARVLLTKMEEVNLQLKLSLSRIYYPETVDEWLGSNISPCLIEIRKLVKNADEQLAHNVP